MWGAVHHIDQMNLKGRKSQVPARNLGVIYCRCMFSARVHAAAWLRLGGHIRQTIQSLSSTHVLQPLFSVSGHARIKQESLCGLYVCGGGFRGEGCVCVCAVLLALLCQVAALTPGAGKHFWFFIIHNIHKDSKR